jgi:putative hydrolase of the HAD superfamily
VNAKTGYLCSSAFNRYMKYKHLFFDLDHTLWDFDTNSRHTLSELYETYHLQSGGITDFDLFHKRYLYHNDILWAKYRNGAIKVDELRWKRMWLALTDFKIWDEAMAREMGAVFLEKLPSRNALFPHTIEVLQYLTDKGYQLHLITNGFKVTQQNKLKNAGIEKFFIHVITSECSQSIKPNKEIFDYAFMKAKASCPECIMIGDSMDADIQGAINAGIDQVYVNHLCIEPVITPTYMVNTLKELEQIF